MSSTLSKPPPASKAHALSETDLMRQLGSSKTGMTDAQAQSALKRHGPNSWSIEQKSTALQILIRQVSNLLILMLLSAAAVSYFIGHAMDAVGILAAVVLSVFFGFFQEYKAEQALSALKKITSPRAIILRNGHEREIDSEQVAIGDILILSEGMLVPADARVLDGGSLSIDQSVLTGESESSHKHSKLLPASTPLAERANMVYAGTQVVRGHGRALVVATGLSTEFGRIAISLSQTEAQPTPLQKQLGQLGEKVGQASIALAILFFLLGILRGQPWTEMLVVAVSLAVAAIPEGLPTVLAITLAIGVQRMATHHALVRKLPAVETLGSATVICTDKTGTLTANQMTLTRLYADGTDYAFHGGPHELSAPVVRIGEEGVISPSQGPSAISSSDRARILPALSAFVLCNDSALLYQSSGSLEGVRGDPTEVALLVAAKKAGLDPEQLRQEQPKQADLPFEYARKMMSQIRLAGTSATSRALARQADAKMDASIRSHTRLSSSVAARLSPANASWRRVVYVKGAPEVILSHCTHIYKDGHAVPMTASERAHLHAVTTKYASQALRTLAVAMRELPSNDGRSGSKSYVAEQVEQKLTWLGVCGMIDPPRPEVKEALRLCQRAGIRVIMLTGDSLVTAKVIAHNLGLLPPGGQVMEASDIEKLSDTQLRQAVHHLSVLARATPEHKYRIITALQANGEVVAVTGDGVNDAPSIKKANIGVAMGIGGTDVARGAADLVLTDNNFGTLVKAVERGRSIYENIRSFVRFQFTTNVAALALMFSSPILGLPLPLAPLQILWINIIMDGPPALALGLEPERSDAMSRPPRHPDAPFISRPLLTAIVRTGVLMFLITLGVFVYYLRAGLDVASTMAFTVFILMQLANALNCRSWRRPFWENISANKFLIAALFLSFCLQLAILYWAPLQSVFGTVALGANEWLVLGGAFAAMLIQEEVFKRYRKAED